MKLRSLFLCSLIAIILLTLAVSAAPCAIDQQIIRISSQTNAHAEIATFANPLGNYGNQICYADLFGIPYTPANSQVCTGNNLVLRLSSQTNAHAEILTQNNYPISVCYGDLQCRSTNAVACAANERQVLTFASATNSHLASDNSYPTKLCCSSAFSGGGGAVCGNNICEAGESFLTCPQDCPIISNCGDSLITGTEQCDGANLGSQTCQSQGFLGGVLGCTGTCQFTTAGCTNNPNPVCGNNIVEPPTEACDGNNFGGQTCQTFGFTGGTLGCSTCQLDQSQCTATNNTLTITNVTTNPAFPINNNGSSQPVTVTFTSSQFPLQVTFNLFNSQNAIVNTQGPFTVISQAGLPLTYIIPGNLQNGVYTLFMTVQNNFGNTIVINLGTIIVNNIVPPTCGNGAVESGETCDGNNFANLQCTDFDSFTSGSLTCDQSCQISTAQCSGGTPPGFCGDGQVNPGETCDGNNLNGLQCSNINGFTGGTLSCNLCQLSTAQCSGGQGNNTNQSGNLFITLLSPVATTYSSSLVLINIQSNGTSVWFTTNGGITNTTYTVPVSQLFADGQYTLVAYASNSSGATVSVSATFSVLTSGGNNNTNGSSGGNGGGGNNNNNRGSFLNSLLGLDDGSLTGAFLEEESNSGKKLPEQSLFARIFKNAGLLFIILLLLLILFLILMILLLAGKKSVKKEQLPELPPRKK